MAIISPIDNRPVYLSSLGTHLVFGRLYAFAQGTDDPKAIYTDEALTTPATHPVLLGDDGRTTTQLFCGEGQYTIEMYRFVGVDPMTAPDTDWELDNSFDLEGNSTVVNPSSNEVTTVGTIAALRLLDPTDFVTADVLGYYTDSDCFTRRYRWDGTSVLSDNYGAVIGSSVTGTGRWILQQEGSDIDCRAFGIIAGSTSTYNSQMTALEAWANAAAVKAIYIPSGTYRFAGAFAYNIRPKVIIEQGVKFYNTIVSTIVSFTMLNDYDVRLVSGIQATTSVGTCTLGFGTGNAEVNSLWFGHVNDSDDHSAIVALMTSYVGAGHPIVLENVLNVATLSASWPLRLKTIKYGLVNCTHDPAGNNCRIELYTLDMATNTALKLTYPNVLSIDYLKNSRLRASWFDNANALTDWSALLESTGIHYTVANLFPTLILDDNIKFASSMSDNYWVIISEGGLIDVHSAGVKIDQLQASGIPVFSYESTHAPAISCPVLGMWWHRAGCSTNQTIEYAITAASTGFGIEVDFAGCGAMTGYSLELVIDNPIEIKNLYVTGTGDFRPQSTARFIDCTMTRTSGATSNAGLISLTGGGSSATSFDVIRCVLTSQNYVISHQPLKTSIVDSTISLSFGKHALWLSSNSKVNKCTINGSIRLQEIIFANLSGNFITGSIDIETSEEYKNLHITNNTISANGLTASKIIFAPTSSGIELNGVFIEENNFIGSLASATKCIAFDTAGGSFATNYYHTARIGGNTTNTGSNILLPRTHGTIQHDIEVLYSTGGGIYESVAQVLAGSEESNNEILVIPGDNVIGSSTHRAIRLESYDSGSIDPRWYQMEVSGIIKKQVFNSKYAMLSTIKNVLNADYSNGSTFPAMVTFENYTLNSIVP